MSITKAIIPVAGWGMRRLPITKAIEKCMLPIGNRPLIDYIVQDCVAAGIKDIYFVVNEQNSQLQAYYSRNLWLESYLKNTGKSELLPSVSVPDIAFHYIVQPQDGRYGTAIPVALCAPMIGDESAVVLMGDDFIFAPGQPNQIEQLMNGTIDGRSCLLGVQVSRDDVSRYGVIRMDTDRQFMGIVEKPTAEDAPSNLINVSKYIMSADLLKEVSAYARTDRGGEYLLTDPINMFVEHGGMIQVIPAVGQYLDGGTLEGWLEANRVVCGDL
jgi:UTP--glucose-1-phosphate uridylyltransferase